MWVALLVPAFVAPQAEKETALFLSKLFPTKKSSMLPKEMRIDFAIQVWNHFLWHNTPIYINWTSFWLGKVSHPLVWKIGILNYAIFSYLTAVVSATVFPIWDFTMGLSFNALASILFTSLVDSRHINLVPLATIMQQASGSFHINENEIHFSQPL